MLSFEDISHIREAEQMRADFVANVSHELRSPLTTLYGFIETLQGPAAEDPEAQKRFLSLMEGEAQRMARLIDELLSLAKLEGEEIEKPTEDADPAAILAQVAEMLAPQAEAGQKKVVLDLGGELPLVPGDEDQLTQLFLNLIENAIKYGRPETEVTVRARLVRDPEGPAGQAVRIDVIDRGEGIPERDIPRLTERFYRVDKGRSRAMGGTGLGLAIVKHILIRHRGRLEIESTPGQGSTFSAFLPVA